MNNALDDAIMKSIDEEDMSSIDINLNDIESNIESDVIVHLPNRKCAVCLDRIIYIIVVGCLSLPLATLDLIYAYRDHSCVGIYPQHRYMHINMQDYLVVHGYLSGMIFLYKMCLICKYVTREGVFDEIVLKQDACQLLVRCFLMVWNILGAIVFFGELCRTTSCNKAVFNYLFVSILIKITVNICIFITILINKHTIHIPNLNPNVV